MHELPVTQGILGVVVDAARRNGGRHITDIDLVIGDMSSIVDDSIQFYFDMLSKDTLADGATLHFRRQPALATCLDCSRQFEVRPPFVDACPNCSGVHLQVSGGRDFYVESIMVQDSPVEDRAGEPTVPDAEVNGEDSGRTADTQRQRSDSI